MTTPSVEVVRVLVVDDHHLFRVGLRSVVASDPSIVVAGEASSCKEAFELIDQLNPDVVTLDVTLPDADGTATAKEMLRRWPNLKLLMLTMHGSHYFVSQSLAAGAKGYALKEQTPSEILQAIKTVSRGETYLAPQIPPELAQSATPSGRARAQAEKGPLDTLSPRERAIFDLIVRGHTNSSMAETLQISIKTIETHRAHINKKLRVHSTGELIRLAALHGLVHG